MTLLREVPVPTVPVAKLEPVIGPDRYEQLVTAATVFRGQLGQRTIWNVSSTAMGGGVAEMLRVLVGYTAGLDIAVRWVVIGADPEFFAITKRLHNQIHGSLGGSPPVGRADAGHYQQVLAANAAELARLMRPGDIALLHDPQTAGRARVLLAELPLDDIDENAAIVNALQRHAMVIVQKSLAEGFGLTVAEGMWKARPVVGSAVGGIQDQLAGGAGVLLPDPADLATFGSDVRRLLDHPDLADRIGGAGHDRVRERYVGDRHLLQYAELFGTIIGR